MNTNPPPVPALTVHNFSGGQQSSALLWMILRKEFVPDSPFLVLNADPGMENEQTYQYVERMRGLCQAQGIEFVTAAGPNLFSDLVELDQTDATRFDLPPYWTRNRTTGKRGRLMQKCTAAYKIAPMDRAVRRKLRDLYGANVSGRIPNNIKIVKFIGFTSDEAHRITESKAAYTTFRYPLIEMGLSKQDTYDYFLHIGETPPPRSVCNACFANSLEHFIAMSVERPRDFAQAVAVDRAIRDLSQVGVTDECYVCSPLVPLDRLLDGEEYGIDEEDYSCDSGHCFI